MKPVFVTLLPVLGLLLASMFPVAARADSAQLYLEALVDFERHAETIWRSATNAGCPPDSGYWGDGNSTGNGGIRGNCGIALAYAVLVNALPDDPKRAHRLKRIQQALTYATSTHITGDSVCVDGKQWGWSSKSSGDWQTPLWAGSLGLACILVESNLPPETVRACQRVVAGEADHRAAIPPASRYIHNTTAEENGWQSNILGLGAAWMAGHPNAPRWLEAAKKYLVNTYTVPDSRGDPLASWITTKTLYPSFALENHNFYHPTYQMVAGMSMGDTYLMARLANPAVAEELKPFAEHNVINVWNSFSGVLLDSGELLYPSGLDWELHDFEHNSYLAWLATHFNEPVARYADARLAQLVRYRQKVNGDGRFVGESLRDGFFREAVEARRTAMAWLHWNIAEPATVRPEPPGPSIRHLADVKLITQRSAFGSVGIVYGARIMAQIEPVAVAIPENAFLTTPRFPGILGLGPLGRATGAQLLRFATNSSGFSAEFIFTNGTNGTIKAYVESTGETIAMVEVIRAASGYAAKPWGSFCVGIENDPLTGGARLLEWSGGSATITNRSGASKQIESPWVCVAERFGIVAGPEGSYQYIAAKNYNRPGAAEDTLEFVGENPVGVRYAVWFLGKNATQTAAAAKAIKWAGSNTKGTLTFPGQGGEQRRLVVTD